MAGRPAALPTASPDTHAAPVRISTLGTFRVDVDGTTVTVPNGLPSRALKVTIVNDGAVHAEVLMEHLWPGIDPSAGRKGIRNILNRLTGIPAPVLVRDGEMLRLADAVVVDAAAFRCIADQAVTSVDRKTATRLARRALTIYGGPFLPADRYVDWTDPTRRRLGRRRLAMLDILVTDARARDATIDAIHLMELALEDDCHDEARYLELAMLLLAAGRRGRAARLLDEATEVLRGLGLTPDPAFARLRRELDRRVGPMSSPVGLDTDRSTSISAADSKADPTETSRPGRHFPHHRYPSADPNHRGATP